MSYFRSFPTTEYSNTACVDITRRVALRRSLVSDRKAYLPYEVSQGDRADQLAADYYQDVSRTWMVYMSADVVDPYHQWHLDQFDFEAHVAAKYGSYERAVELTHCWELNWYSDQSEITQAGYDALDDTVKKYWEAVYGQGSQILYYVRRREDWWASTNMVVRLSVTPQNNTAIGAGDLLTVYTGAGVRDGTAEVAWANSSVVKVQHVQANVSPGQVVRTDAGANAVVAEATYVSNTIPVDERPYWSRLSKYDWENQRNEARRNIRLVDVKHASKMEFELRKLLAE